MSDDNFRELQKSLIEKIRTTCQSSSINEVLKFTSVSFDNQYSGDQDICEIAKIVKEIAVNPLLDKLGDGNRPLWLSVICYDLQNIEGLHDNHLCYGTKPDLGEKFKSLAEEMFLLSSIPAGQNHVHLEYLERQTSKIQLSNPAPITNLFWKLTTDDKPIPYIDQSVSIIANGSIHGSSTNFSYIINEINRKDWKNHFEDVINGCYYDNITSLLKRSIYNFINEYPCEMLSNGSEMVCMFIPGTKYGGQIYTPFAKDGTLICFDNWEKAERSILILRKWNSCVTKALDLVIKDLLAKPRFPVNIYKTGKDLKKFIKNIEANQGVHLDLISKDCYHNPAAINSDNCSDESKQTMRSIVEHNYPNYLRELQGIIGDIQASAYAASYIYNRIKADSNELYLADILATSREAGWDIIINNTSTNMDWIKDVFFDFVAPNDGISDNWKAEQLMIILSDLIKGDDNAGQVSKRKQFLRQDQGCIIWVLDLLIVAPNDSNKNIKKIHLNFDEHKGINTLHRVIRAVEILSQSLIAIYPDWNVKKDFLCRNSFDIDDPSEEILIKLGDHKNQSFMILSAQKTRFIVKRTFES
jgi:hypothetical protein